MATFTTEIGLSVIDLPQYGFEEIHKAVNEAITEFNDMATDISNGKLEVTPLGAEFVECDSGNISHANAYFEITYEADHSLDEYE